MNMVNEYKFFAYARERFKVKLNKEAGLVKPWTEDKVLQQYRFCNVHREDDTVTKWIRQNINENYYGNRLLGALIIARWFNRIETLKILQGSEVTDKNPFPRENLLYNWAPSDNQPALTNSEPNENSWKAIKEWSEKVRERLKGVSPIITGAYIIKTPSGFNKLDGILWALQRVLTQAVYYQGVMEIKGQTLENCTRILTQFPYLGPFMAYEVVTDLRHTPILKNAPDILFWANPGPGCARGICRIYDREISFLDRHNKKDVEFMLVVMRELLHLSKDERYWPQKWPKWEMREVEHTLCEFDKYSRALLGQGTPKQKYSGV